MVITMGSKRGMFSSVSKYLASSRLLGVNLTEMEFQKLVYTDKRNFHTCTDIHVIINMKCARAACPHLYIFLKFEQYG